MAIFLVVYKCLIIFIIVNCLFVFFLSLISFFIIIIFLRDVIVRPRIVDVYAVCLSVSLVKLDKTILHEHLHIPPVICAFIWYTGLICAFIWSTSLICACT